MKRVLHPSFIIALLKGEPVTCLKLTCMSKADVVLPQIVIARLELMLRALPDKAPANELRARFERLRSEVPHGDWTEAVTAAFLRIKAEVPDVSTFEAAVAAHALAVDGTLVVDGNGVAPSVSGLKLDDRWGRNAEGGKS